MWHALAVQCLVLLSAAIYLATDVGPADASEPKTLLKCDAADGQWIAKAQGPWIHLSDKRGPRGMRYPWHISTTGEYAEISRQITIPADTKPPYTLTFFCSDDYTDDGFRQGDGNSIDAYPGHRFKQVLIDGEVAWERDIADDSASRAAADFAVVLGSGVRAGEPFMLALRNFDKVGMDTRLPTDFYLRGVYEGDRPEGNYVLATTCWWGDVAIWQGQLAEAPKQPRPSSAEVERIHRTRWPYPPRGQEAALSVRLNIEGLTAPLSISTPVTCGVPLPEGRVRRLEELSLKLGETELPWQPEVMNTWPDGSLRWIMVNTVLPAGTSPDAVVTLLQEFQSAQPLAPIEALEEDGGITIQSGDLVLRCGTNRERLIDSIVWAGQPICAGLCSEATKAPAAGNDTGVPLKATFETFKLLRRGPIRATIEATGTMSKDGERLGPVICRIDLYAGVPGLRITHRITNAGAERVDLSSVQLVADLNKADKGRVAVGLPQGPERIDAPTASVVQTDPDHYTLGRNNEQTAAEGRAPGWIAVGNGQAWLSAAVRHFWQQGPAALAASPRQLTIGLFHGSEKMPVYGWRAGEAKRHELWLSFGSGALDAPSLQHVNSVCLRPLRLFNSPYFCASEGLGSAYPHDDKFAPVAEHMSKTYPDASYASLAACFGVRDFGDGYYTQATPTFRNNYYDVMRGLFGEYLMSGDGKWFDRGEEASRHYMDIDQFHDSQRSHDQRGANASVYTPNHNDDFGIWSAMLNAGGGMISYWRLSGDVDARDSALMLADYIVRTKAGKGAASVRDNAGSLLSLVWAYDETRDQRYLDTALEIAESVKQRLIPRRGCYAETHGSHNYRGNVPWMDAQLAEPLYLLYRHSGQLWVADMMVGLMESCVYENMNPASPGQFQGYTHSPVLHRNGWNTAYNVLIAPCVGLAYELTKNPYLLEVMRGAYNYTVATDKNINDVHNCYWMTPTLLYLLHKNGLK